MSYRIIPDMELRNNEGKCNSDACPNPEKRIYWNDAVRNKETGKKMPLNEPFTGQKPPQPHRCMRQYRPGKYINKTNDSFLDSISYSKEFFAFLRTSRWSYQKLT